MHTSWTSMTLPLLAFMCCCDALVQAIHVVGQGLTLQYLHAVLGCLSTQLAA